MQNMSRHQRGTNFPIIAPAPRRKHTLRLVCPIRLHHVCGVDDDAHAFVCEQQHHFRVVSAVRRNIRRHCEFDVLIAVVRLPQAHRVRLEGPIDMGNTRC